MLQEAAHVLEPIVEVPYFILKPPIQELTHVPESTAEEAQPPQSFGQRRDKLRYLYQALTPPSSRSCGHLQSFRPTVGPFTNYKELGDINNPQYMDVDAACFFMLNQNLFFVVRSHNTARQS